MADNFDPYHKWLGIPPRDQPPNHYRLLGIEPLESDEDVIEAAANRLMAFLQDMATGEHVEQSQAILDAIADARLCLLTPADKAQYDQALREKIASPQATNIPTALPVAPPAPAHPTPAPPPSAPPIATSTCPACNAPRAHSEANCDHCDFKPHSQAQPTQSQPTQAQPTISPPKARTTPVSPPPATLPTPAPHVIATEPPETSDATEEASPDNRRQRLILMVLGGSVCTLLIALFAAMLALPKATEDEPTANAQAPPVDATAPADVPLRQDDLDEDSPTTFRGRLNLRIAAELRSEVSGWIDDMPLEIPAQGACSVTIEPGRHLVRMERPGYEPFEQTIDIRLGYPNLVVPTWQLIETAPQPADTATADKSGTPEDGPKNNQTGKPNPQPPVTADKQAPPKQPENPPNKPQPATVYRPWSINPEVELPSSPGEPVTLGKVQLQKGDQLNMRLIGGDAVLGDDRRFSLRQLPSPSRTFAVLLTAKKDAPTTANKPTTVATFALVDQALQFRWEANDLHTAGVLRNCKLVLISQQATGKNKQRVISLRKPQTCQPFALLGTFGTSEERLAVSDRPDMSALELVATGLQIAGKKSLLEGIRLQPGSEQPRTIPVPAKQFQLPLRFRLELSTSLRLQSKAQVGMPPVFVTQRNTSKLANQAFQTQIQTQQQKLVTATTPAMAKAASDALQRIQVESSKISNTLKQGGKRFQLHFDLLCHLTPNQHIVLLTTRPAAPTKQARKAWVAPSDIEVTSTQGHFESSDEQAFQIHGLDGSAATYAIAFRPSIRRLTGIRIEALADPLEPGPGLGKGGQAVLNRVTLSHANQPLTLSKPWSNSQHKRREWGEMATLHDDPEDRHGWKIDGKDIGQNMFIAYHVDYPDDLQLDTYAPYRLQLHFFGDEAPPFGCIRFCITAAKQPHSLPEPFLNSPK